jgi:pectate lyase
VLSYRAAADFDNVIVAPAPLATIWAQALGEVCQPACANRAPWSYTGGQWTWNGEGVFRQAVITGDARAIVGAPTSNKDQIFEARVRPATFGTPADPWAGIMVGYTGPGDYVYLSLRKSNTLQLRRLRGGQITQLGSQPITVTPGTWYTLRLEQVADRLRGYVNGVQKFEVVQDQWNAGQVGLVTYAAAADYDDVLAVRP